jgi:hypothetical protein
MDQSSKIDISRLKLLRGLPIEFEDICLIHPMTLNDIAIKSYQTVFQSIHLLLLSIEDLNEDKEEHFDHIFDYIMFYCKNNIVFLNEFTKALYLVINEKIRIVTDLGSIIIGKPSEKRVITKDNFNNFQIIVATQNCLDDKVRKLNPGSAGARDLAEKFKERERILKKLKKKKNNTTMDFADLIGSVAVGGIGMNINNIWETPYYAFYDQLQRMQMKENYQSAIQAILAGAKISEDKIRHWVNNIPIKD